MVNPGKVLKARKSKRQSLHDKHKIDKKIREHHKKTRRDMKKNPKKHMKKDPGIPNSWPFKQQLLQQQEEQRVATKEAMVEAREHKILERQQARQAEAALLAAQRMTSQQRRDLKRQQAAFAPIHDILADADIVIIALDARDPPACRSAALEQALLEVGKLPVLALTKCDLVPRVSVDGWLAELGSRLPTLPFVCAPSEGAAGAASKDVKNYSRAAKLSAGAVVGKKKSGGKAAKAQPTGGVGAAPSEPTATAEAATMKALAALVTARRAALKAAAGKSAAGDEEPLSIGIIGFERVGKRALHRQLTEAAGAEGSPLAASGVSVLKLPALLAPAVGQLGENDVLLRKGMAEHVPQPEAITEAILDRCEQRSLLRHFGVAAFDEAHEFLTAFAEAHQLPLPRTLPGAAGLTDARAAAVGFLKHVSAGKMAFSATPPPAPPGGAAAAAAAHAELLGKGWAKTAGALLDAAAAEAAGSGVDASSVVAMSAGAADEIAIEEEAEAFEVDDEDDEEGEEEDEEDEGEEEDGEEEDGEEEEGEEEDMDEEEDEEEE